MEFFFKPQSIIIFGASSKEGKSGYYLLKNILKYNPKRLILIHPVEENIFGIKCYKNITEIPNELIYGIDLAIVSVPAQFVTEIVLKCIEICVKGILIQSGNIGLNEFEISENKKRILDALKKAKLLKNQTIRIMGPNSLGIFNNLGLDENNDYSNFFTGIMDFKFQPPFNKEGKNLTIVAQTGLLLSGYYIDFFEKQDICISKIIALGNKLDINESDVLEFLINDSNTKTITFYLENIKEGRRFFNLCKKAIFEFNKTIILLTSGKSELGKKAITSHTESIANNSLMIEALCKQLGIIQVSDFSELILASKFATHMPLPQGNRLGLISISGAGCVLLSDFAEEFNFKVPQLNEKIKRRLKNIFPEWAEINNPLDLWASIEQIGSKAYDIALETFLESNKFDIIIFCSIAERRAQLNYSYLKDLSKKFSRIPIILQIFGGSEEIKKELSKQFENPNNDNYIPIVYNLRQLFIILFKIYNSLALRYKISKSFI